MINKKTENKLVFNFAMLLVLIALQIVALTGKPLHEITAIVFLGFVVAHCILYRQRILNLVKSIKNKKATPVKIAQVIIDIALFVTLILLFVSGIMISVFAFRIFNIPYNRAWHWVHFVTSKVFLGVVIAHFALHARTIIVILGQKNKKNTKEPAVQPELNPEAKAAEVKAEEPKTEPEVKITEAKPEETKAEAKTAEAKPEEPKEKEPEPAAKAEPEPEKQSKAGKAKPDAPSNKGQSKTGSK